MKAYHICYHTDEDGLASASVIYEYLKRVNDEKKGIRYFFYKIDYTVNLKDILKNIPSGDEIYFVDYSFSNLHNLEYILELSNKDIKVTWIDHHKSSKEIVDKSKYSVIHNKDEISLYGYANFYYLINTNYCGAYLAYAYAFNRINGCYMPSNDIQVPLLFDNEIPLYIKYVDSWDTWKHNMPNTTEFNLGIQSMKRTPRSALSSILKYDTNIINKLFSDKEEDNKVIESCMKDYIDKVISKGKVIKSYQDTINESLCNDYAFEFEIIDNSDGNNRIYKCLALNKRGNSTMFGNKINYYDIVVPLQFNGKQFVYSLYTSKDDVCCDILAKKLGTYNGLGGGGHAKAAGFQTYRLLIEANCKIKISNKLFKKDKYNIILEE